ncbi:hypothetical protein UFOVP46_68 [uncultured Caudovirales phage]|uniref:Uncharacterized protein n=1 Tax=uncultured Caudovirales phage TaxID=2100421 RepID=A0A6J5KQS5_9CAUD|nr:hypothetical protein UFOVP46_68 [uncultured Caudovirales phage]
MSLEHFNAGNQEGRGNRPMDAEDVANAPGKLDTSSQGKNSVVTGKSAKPVTAKTRGVEVNQTIPTKDFVRKVGEFTTLLSDRAREINAKAPTATTSNGEEVRTSGRPSAIPQSSDGPELEARKAALLGGKVKTPTARLASANVALGAAKTAIDKGNDFRYGNNKNGHNPDNVLSITEAHKHYKTALGHVVTAHGHLHSDEVTQALGAAGAHITTESIHPLELKALQAHGDTLAVNKPAEAFKTVRVGDKAEGAGIYKVGSPELEKLKKDLPEPIPKVAVAERGTPRKSAVQKARKARQAREGFVPPSSKAEEAPAIDPRKKSDNISRPGSGVMAQSKPGTRISPSANVSAKMRGPKKQGE